VQTPPDDLSEDVLVSVLAREWGLAVASMTYRPLGFGSHHWQIVDAGGTRWFGTVDELETKRHSAAESLDTAFDRLSAALGAARALPDRAVLTHGEPHRGNTMLTPTGWRLIDWDTVLVGPPERDLWMLDPGDGSILDAYAEATGVSPLAPMIELYRIGWDLSDMALYVSRFRGKHTGSLDDDKSWRGLRSMVESLAQPRRP
jgi:hypothetical protein